MIDPELSDSSEIDNSWMSNSKTNQEQPAKLPTKLPTKLPAKRQRIGNFQSSLSQKRSVQSKKKRDAKTPQAVIQDEAFSIITENDKKFAATILTQFGSMWNDKHGFFETSMHYGLPYEFTRITDPLMRIKNFLRDQSGFQFSLAHELKSGEIVTRWKNLDSVHNSDMKSHLELVKLYQDFLSLRTVQTFVQELAAYKGTSVIIQMARTTMVAMKLISELQLKAAKKAITVFMTRYHNYLAQFYVNSDSE